MIKILPSYITRNLALTLNILVLSLFPHGSKMTAVLQLSCLHTTFKRRNKGAFLLCIFLLAKRKISQEENPPAPRWPEVSHILQLQDRLGKRVADILSLCDGRWNLEPRRTRSESVPWFYAGRGTWRGREEGSEEGALNYLSGCLTLSSWTTPSRRQPANWRCRKTFLPGVVAWGNYPVIFPSCLSYPLEEVWRTPQRNQPCCDISFQTPRVGAVQKDRLKPWSALGDSAHLTQSWWLWGRHCFSSIHFTHLGSNKSWLSDFENLISCSKATISTKIKF